MRARAREAADALRSSITGRAARLPEWLWVPASSGVAILAVGLIAHAVGQPLLFASLGPTVFMHVYKPWHETARFYNTVVGHGVAVAAAAAVVVTGAVGTPAVLSSEQVPMARVASAVIATAGTALLQVLSGAAHPPAASTTLLIALGGFALTAMDMADVALGVLVIAVLGVPLRWLRLASEEAVSRRVDERPDSA